MALNILAYSLQNTSGFCARGTQERLPLLAGLLNDCILACVSRGGRFGYGFLVLRTQALCVLFQGFSALVIYGKLPIKAPSWLGKAHRASGTTALVLATFVAYHCLWALGLEYGHLSDGEKVGARTVIHGVLGCMVFGTAVVKIVAVRSRRAPGWFLPVVGGLLFTLFIAALLTSTVWYYVNYGWPDSNSY